MKSVLKSYLPLLVWLALAACALLPPAARAAEDVSIEQFLSKARALLATQGWSDLARMTLPPAGSAAWAAHPEAESELLLARGIGAAQAGYPAMAMHSIERLESVGSEDAQRKARDLRVMLAQAAPSRGKVFRIGYVSGGAGPTFEAFRAGLRSAGYVEGQDVVIDARFSDGQAERFSTLIAALLGSGIDVLVAGSPPGAIAAVKADTVVPIVIAGNSDPHGIARSLGRPAAHITGPASPAGGIAPRWLSMLRDIRPQLQRAAVLVNTANPSSETWTTELNAAAREAGVKLDFYNTPSDAELARSLKSITESGAQGLIVTGDPVFLRNRAQLVAFAAAGRLPAVYFSKLFADDGGLVAYGGSLEDSYRRAAAYADQILKGKSPAHLPPERVAVELVVNQRTAKALAIAIPESILRAADKVIE